MSRPAQTVVTARDRGLFELLGRARWLSTAQIQRRFFPGKSLNAVNKRMRRLVRAQYLRRVRPTLMDQCYFRLTATGADRLRDDGGRSIGVPKRFPRQVSHFAAINDVRLWLDAQFARGAASFWAEWELKDLNRDRIVPDGVALLRLDSGTRRLAIEVDLATENSQFLVQKMKTYDELALRRELPFDAVLVTATGWPRLRSLISACYRAGLPAGALRLWFVELEQLAPGQLPGLIDLAAVSESDRLSRHSLQSLLDECPVGISCREDGQSSVSAGENGTSPFRVGRDYAGAE